MPTHIPDLINSIFADLDEDGVEDLLFSTAHAIASFKTETYPAGTTLCHQGEEEDLFYVIINGEVEIYLNLADGLREMVATKGPGEYFGEMALVLASKRSADVVTSKETMVLELDRRTFNRAMKRSPHIASLMADSTKTQLDQNFHKEEETRGQRFRRFQIFTSYSRSDANFVQALVDNLQRDLIDNNVFIWLDQKHIKPGQPWDSAIQEALDESDAMLLVMSEDAHKSEHVTNEWSYYLHANKPIIPILKEDCKRHHRLIRLQYLDFYAGDYNTAIARLHAAILEEARKADLHSKSAS